MGAADAAGTAGRGQRQSIPGPARLLTGYYDGGAVVMLVEAIRVPGAARQWWRAGVAMLIALLVHMLWRVYGPSCLAAWGLPPTAWLMSALSFGQIIVSPFSPHPDYGWVFQFPGRFVLQNGAQYHPVLPFPHAAAYLLPGLTFLACLLVMGGPLRRRPGLWVIGIGGGIAWYLLAVLAQLTHVLTVAMLRQPSPFFPGFDLVIPPLPIVGADWLQALFYPSGLLTKVMAALSHFAGLMPWLWWGLRELLAGKGEEQKI